MIKIAICDDVVHVTKWMKKAIEDHSFAEKVNVDTFSTGQELYESAKKEKYDVVFMDIELVPGKEEGNGMLVSRKIKEMYPEVLIIFFTGTFGYEASLLNFEPFRFIRKPFGEDELIRAVNDCIDRIKRWDDKYFDVKNDLFTYSINLSHVLYFSSRWPYIDICSLYESLEFRDKLDNVEERIRELSSNFIRVNKSHLVNRKYIKSFSKKSIIMTNDVCIQIGKKYADVTSKTLKSEKTC